jgi:hypothetical protein
MIGPLPPATSRDLSTAGCHSPQGRFFEVLRAYYRRDATEDDLRRAIVEAIPAAR